MTLGIYKKKTYLSLTHIETLTFLQALIVNIANFADCSIWVCGNQQGRSFEKHKVLELARSWQDGPLQQFDTACTSNDMNGSGSGNESTDTLDHLLCFEILYDGSWSARPSGLLPRRAICKQTDKQKVLTRRWLSNCDFTPATTRQVGTSLFSQLLIATLLNNIALHKCLNLVSV